jgi:hypothetical protein
MPDETARPSGLLLCCPRCGAPLARPYVRTTYDQTTHEHTDEEIRAPEARGGTYDPTTALPPRAGAPVKATLWTRALAIAHRAIDEYPGDGPSQTDAFKVYCLEQGLDPYQRPGPQGRPLYARALDAAHERGQRGQRKAAQR